MNIEEIIEFYKEIIPIESVNPAFGGNGEEKRALYLKNYLYKNCKDFQYEEYTTKDIKGFTRPNMLFLLNANKKDTVWFVVHIDTVDAGDEKAWKYPPFQATIVNDLIYGRGTTDDIHGVAMGVLAFRYFSEHRTQLQANIGLVIVSDEENGSKYGIKEVLKHRKFSHNDYFLVPDWGVDDGSKIETAEKGIMWISIKVKGKQSHGSRPDLGINAHRMAMKLESQIDEHLHKKFSERDEIFIPPYSTFEPTKGSFYTKSINIIPEMAEICFDMRILPKYTTNEVLDEVKYIVKNFEKSNNIGIELDVIQKEGPYKPTSMESPLIKNLKSAIEATSHIKTTLYGIGGGTCAAHLREQGYDAAVWATLDEGVEHTVNEYASINKVALDIKISETLLSQWK
jgi:succinyl-diaminopimelate desuccinylase